MLSVRLVQGIGSERPSLPTPQLGVITAGFPPEIDSRKPLLLQQQEGLVEPQLDSTPPQMDDFLLEQVFPLSWFDMVAENKASWDFNGGSSGMCISTDAADGSSAPPRPLTMPLNASGTPSSSTGVRCQASELQETIGQFQGATAEHYPLDDTSGANGLQQRCIQRALDAAAGISGGEPRLPKGIHESFRPCTSQGMSAEGAVGLQFSSGNPSIADSTASRLMAAVTFRAPGLPRSPSVGSSGSEGPALQQSPSSPFTPQFAAAWQQSYLQGTLPPALDIAQAKAESFLMYKGMPDDPISHEKMCSADDATGRSLSGLPDDNSGGAQVGPSQKAQSEAGQQSHQQGGHGSIMASYGAHTGVAQTQGAAAAIFSGTTRPRQRARRGQATDPHSIAERLRRERIAERMKALQELVPNANKTDKASMLDEIVNYVKFLQLQVKVLSMSRLGGAGTAAPLIADLPVEGPNNFIAAALGWNAGSSSPPQDAMTLVERQVARLMEEDMGSAMRFLQGRGLCLMPVSLATTISVTNSRTTGGMRALTFADCSQIDASNSRMIGGCSNGSFPCIGTISDSNSGDGDGVCFDGGSKPCS